MKNLYKHSFNFLLIILVLFSYNESKAVTCAIDTVHYTLNKSSAFRAITLGASSASSVAQYYRAPQPITVSGFEFYAYASATPTITLNCAIYLAAADSSPTGAALSSVNVVVDSSTIDIYNTVLFPTPVTVSANYVLVVTNPSATLNASIVCNDYVAHDGLAEYFALGKIAGTWLKGDDIVVGTFIFDADWIIEPYVSFENNDSIYAPVTTVCAGSPLTFSGYTNPVISDDMYNVNAFIGATPTNTFGWTFGDTTLTRTNLQSVTHTYYTPGTYTLTLYDTLRRWRGVPCIGTRNISINVLPNIVSSSYTNSSGSLVVNFTNTSTASINYTWSFGDGGTATTTNPSHTYAAPGRYYVCLVAYNICDTASYCDSITVTCSAPSTPGSITGPSAFCLGDIDTFSVSPVSGATSYIWTYPGWTGSSTSNTIILTAGVTAGNISVSATSVCGTSAASNLSVTIGLPPATPGSITGLTTYCPGDTNTYSIASVSGATSYTWSTTGWTGTSTTNSITLIASATAGNVSVVANNNCGSSSPSNLTITAGPVPSNPGTISGPTNVCIGDTVTYSVLPVSGALSYTWTTPGWTGTSTTNSITLITTASSGNIQVFCSNHCGNSTASSLVITRSTIPATPGTINGASSIVCPGSTQVLSVLPISGATSYNWTLPSGWTGTSTSNSISTIVGTSAGTVTVSATNLCGTSGVSTSTYTLGTIPDSPTVILGPSSTCANSLATYSIATVAGATSYIWSLPSGWSGTSSSNSINVTTGTISGPISVAAVNACGLSSSVSLNVIINTLSVSIGTTPQTQIPANGTISISSPLGGTGPYQYALNAGPFQSGTVFTNVVSDTHQVVVRDVNGCTQVFDVYVSSTVGIMNNEMITHLMIYPNPTSDFLNIDLNLNQTANMKLILLDVLGKKIWEENLQNIKDYNSILNISNYSKGSYILRIETEGYQMSRRILIN